MRRMSEASWLEVVTPIVKRAGTMIRRFAQSDRAKDARRKARGDWVTQMDKQSEAMIVDGLKKYFPDHGILAEESGLRGDVAQCWVIDPLDGTTNFVHGLPHCAVSVAFCRDGAPQLAVVYDIFRDELYTAARSRGAYLDGARLRVSLPQTPADALLMVGGQLGAADGALWQLVARLAKSADGARRSGSSVLDLAWLAARRVDAVFSGPAQYWDVAAASLLTREAGGLIADVRDNTEFVFNQPTACFVAASPKIFTRFFYDSQTFCRERDLL